MLDKWEVSIPELSGDMLRSVTVYVPDAAQENPDARFPVMYVFDGQNIFVDEDASFGQSWGMLEFLTETQAPVIVVGIDNNQEGDMRLCEYSPFSHDDSILGRIKGMGRKTMNWIVRELKPKIDEEYPTLPERENTIIAGSSMGGLMALFGVTAFNRYFRCAACLSPSLWVDPAKVHHMLRRAHMAEDTLIYVDYGSIEMGNHPENVEALLGCVQSLMRRGVDLTFRVVPGGTHSEESWRERLPVVFECLGF